MKPIGIRNPLAATRLCEALERELKSMGFEVQYSEDMYLLDETKRKCRGFGVAPMHDPSVTTFDNGRAFWLSLIETQPNQVVGIQAFRLDEISTNLADWCMNYMIGVYMRREELMVPSHSHSPAGSVAERLSGRLAYHGEFWVEKSVKPRKAIEIFSILGIILAHLKWHTDAIWALASDQVARHGYHVVAAYTNKEKGFLRWQWASNGIDPIEYLFAVEKVSVDALIEELSSSDLN